jgi:hypothetical protein
MTKCPTCGQWARKGQETCSHCGAMLTEISFSTAPHAAAEEPRKSAPKLGRWDMHPTGPVFEAAPVFEATEEAGEADAATGEAHPSSEPPETPEPAPPRRPPWIRVLIILAFFLFPVISSFLRNWSSFRQPTAPPVLREVVIAESLTEGAPLHPRTSFSLRRDREIAFSSSWTGPSEGHKFALLWMEPQRGVTTERAARNGSAVVLRRESEGEAFSVSGRLPLDSAMPEGEWEVRLLLDGQLRGSAKFKVQE